MKLLFSSAHKLTFTSHSAAHRLAGWAFSKKGAASALIQINSRTEHNEMSRTRGKRARRTTSKLTDTYEGESTAWRQYWHVANRSIGFQYVSCSIGYREQRINHSDGWLWAQPTNANRDVFTIGIQACRLSQLFDIKYIHDAERVWERSNHSQPQTVNNAQTNSQTEASK